MFKDPRVYVTHMRRSSQTSLFSLYAYPFLETFLHIDPINCKIHKRKAEGLVLKLGPYSFFPKKIKSASLLGFFFTFVFMYLVGTKTIVTGRN